MTRKEFLDTMVVRGRIKQEDADLIESKKKQVDDALVAYKAGKSTMAKTQLTALLDAISDANEGLKVKEVKKIKAK